MSAPTLESLRAQGADRHDPVRYRYLQAMAERLPLQPPAVQDLLARRLQHAVAAYAERVHAIAVARPAEPAAQAVPSPLARLNRELQDRAQADADRVRIDGGASVSDMRSVRQFSELWSRMAAEQQVLQALGRVPENAGPLNPHKLMLRSLSLMRDLSPDYLRRFLAQMDALLWLEQANAPSLRLLRPQRAPRSGSAGSPGRSGRAR
ncbi:MAG TPA: DUF2894 domain-containing protein [Acidovorax sp.]|jgi:hypothetical protein|nr:DUF2894 domain-containing protein [Acidovorax sp.]